MTQKHEQEDESKRSRDSLVHDSEAVDIQGRHCHPRGQAKGSQCWAHIEQSPLKLQEGPEISFSGLALRPVSSCSCSSSGSKLQAGSVRQKSDRSKS